MSLYVAYAALLTGVVVWGLLVSRLTGKSWQTKDAVGALGEGGTSDRPPAEIGFWIFLGVISSLFALFITADHMRVMAGMERGEWCHFPVPPLLWANTVVLMLGSAAMQWARAAADRGGRDPLRARLVTGGLLTGAFLVGQALAWREVIGSPLFSVTNPAVAFFYLLTAVHGLHLAGGLCVWGWTVRRLSRPGVKPLDVRLTVRLCTIYWHYLLVVWLVLFALLLST